ncbi:MAG: radical SAM protein [Planctomycetes bacterium]|nr:radical SAM protein [Planctomycetota bacterium]
MFKKMPTPSSVQLELTNICNQKCRHCYNFWRKGSFTPMKMSRSKLDFILDQCIDCKVFNVVLSGGEVFINFEQFLYAVDKLTKAGVGVSSDTNLMLATEDKMKKLYNSGLEHVLTSFNSYDEATNDFIVSLPGAQKKIIKGIEAARKAGIRVSVNFIVSNLNKDHVYKTGKFLSTFGINKLFSTRLVPSTDADPKFHEEALLKSEEEYKVLDDMIRVRDDFNIPIGSLIQYPVCFLKDVNKYKDYVSRGCPGGKKMVCLDVYGEGHACVHESKSYGNIFEIGLRGIWENLELWRTDEILPEDCRGCSWRNECEGACRFSALTSFGDLAGKDRLMTGSNVVYDILPEGVPETVYRQIEAKRFKTLRTVKFRDDGDFYTISRLGADVVQVAPQIGKFLEQKHHRQDEFSIEDFGREGRDILADALWKQLMVPIG